MALPSATLRLPEPARLTTVELLSVASEIPDSAFLDGTNSRWRNGAEWVTRDCDSINIVAATCTEGNPLQDGLEMESETTVDDDQEECFPDSKLAFMIWNAISGSTLSLNDGVLTSEVLSKHGDWLSYIFAQELITGAVTGAGLADDADVIGATVSVANGAVGVMEAWLGSMIGNVRGMLHVSKKALAALYAHQAITYEGGRYYTPSGHVVVADAGYQESIMTPNGQAAGAAGTSWAYITGPVWYKSDVPSVLGEDWQRLNREKNIMEVISTSFGLLVYRECSVGAMLLTF